MCNFGTRRPLIWLTIRDHREGYFFSVTCWDRLELRLGYLKKKWKVTVWIHDKTWACTLYMIFDDKRSKESSVCVISDHRDGTILLLQLQLRERQPPVRHRPFSHKNSDEVFNVKSRESNIATGQMDIRTYNFKVMQMKAGHKTTVQCG